jgi:hypothetical protein
MIVILAWTLLGSVSIAGSATIDAELEFLLDAVEQSDCTFTRNGSEHPAAAAAAHLRMKYQRAGAWVKGADQFIERLASRSSMSGKPYTLQCGEALPMPTQQWLQDKLAGYRAASPTVRKTAG